jgi:hypothetical protein
VATETQKIVVRMDADARLVAAAGGVARYFADAAGLDNSAVSNLQSATIAVCNQDIETLEKTNRGLEVTVTRSPDRIEVALSSPATSGVDGAEEVAKTIAGIDQVESELRSGKKITRLTKFVNAKVSGA